MGCDTEFPTVVSGVDWTISSPLKWLWGAGLQRFFSIWYALCKPKTSSLPSKREMWREICNLICGYAWSHYASQHQHHFHSLLFESKRSVNETENYFWEGKWLSCIVMNILGFLLSIKIFLSCLFFKSSTHLTLFWAIIFWINDLFVT